MRYNITSMAEYKKDITPLLMHWSYIFLALTHGHDIGYSNTVAEAEHKSQFNSLRLNDTYMHHQPRPSFVQIMACCLASNKPLSEPVLEYCWFDLWEQIKLQWIPNWNLHIFIQENAFENVVWEMLAILFWPHCVKVITHKRDYMPCHHGQAMGCLLWGFSIKLTMLLWQHIAFISENSGCKDALCFCRLWIIPSRGHPYLVPMAIHVQNMVVYIQTPWLCLNKSNLSNTINSSPPGQDGHHFADNIFRCNFMNEKFCILFKISLKFVP